MTSFVSIAEAINAKFTGICLITMSDHVCHFKEGKLHRLDGPALYTNMKNNHWGIFAVYGKVLSEEDYWKHSYVSDNKLTKIIEYHFDV